MAGFLRFLAIHQYTFINGLIRLVARTLYADVDTTKPPEKILIVRKGTLGDVVCAVPAINELKQQFRDSVIDLLTFTNNHPEIGAQALLPAGYFNEVFDLGNAHKKELWKRIKENRYDAVIELPQNLDTLYTQLRNLFFFRLAGISSGAGWAVTQTLFLKNYQKQFIQADREQQRLQRILTSYGLKTSVNTDLRGTLNVEPVKQAGVRSPYIVIAPGAKYQSKRWPADRYKQLAFSLIAQGYTVVLLGNESDRKDTETWISEQVINLCGKTTVAQSAGILQHAAVTICNDSGPMHLSYHLGTRVIAIFSARGYAGKWYPPDDGKNEVIRLDVPCSVCLLKSCNHHICMEQVTVEMVLEKVSKALAGEGGEQ